MRNNIQKLEQLIEEFNEEYYVMEQMQINWDEYDDPLSDPGLQFEQGEKVNGLYDEIRNFARNMCMKLKQHQQENNLRVVLVLETKMQGRMGLLKLE